MAMIRVGRLFPELLRCLARPPATVDYPKTKVPVPADFRGMPRLAQDKCIGCGACKRDCPSGAIDLADVGTKLPKPSFLYERCAFCAQCFESCPREAIVITTEYHLSAYSKEELHWVPRYEGTKTYLQWRSTILKSD